MDKSSSISKFIATVLAFLVFAQPFVLIFALASTAIASSAPYNYAYDYNNRLISATNTATGTITTYDYDWQGQRIKTVVKNPDGSSTTTLTPFKTYSVSYTTDANGNKSPEKITKYINVNEALVATVNGTGQTAIVQPVLTDHQGSTTHVLSPDNKPAETIDYYPFGEIRLDNTIAGQDPQQKKFLSQDFDSSTDLNYLNARYYNSNIGRFTTQDPVVLALGDDGLVKQLTGKSQEEILQDPQQLNAYSYARNNPITLSDPSGKCAWDLCAVEGAVATSPMWAPAIVAGATAVVSATGYYGYNAYEQQRLRQVSAPLPTIESLAGQPPGGSGLDPTPNKNTPKWGKWGFIGLTAVGAVKEVYDLFNEQSNAIKKFNNKNESLQNKTDAGNNGPDSQNLKISNQQPGTINNNQPPNNQFQSENKVFQQVLNGFSNTLSKVGQFLYVK